MMKLFSYFMKGLTGAFRGLPDRLKELAGLPALLCRFWRYFRKVGFRCWKPRMKCRNEIEIPPEVYKRADPMLYSQEWLMGMGLSVTWNNPDIQLYHNGLPVSSSGLEPDSKYEVRVRIWNNSNSAPAPGLPVHLSYSGFGAGTTSSYLGKRLVDLGAKATSKCPVFASFNWKTPAIAGHYCLRARLDWPDDANPQNNIGQENTNVGIMQSPANFTFQVGNEASIERKLVFEIDDYVLPELPKCPETPGPKKSEKSRIEISRERWEIARNSQGFGMFDQWKREWDVHIEPEKWILDAGETVSVKASIEHRDTDFSGSKAFNINIFLLLPDLPDRKQFIGGVTLYAERE